MNESCLTLRIKKKYLDQIKSGEKSSEYRSNNEHYQKLLSKNPTCLVLHYQNPLDKLRVNIKKISVIKITDELKQSGFFQTDTVFKIDLERVSSLKLSLNINQVSLFN